MTPDDILQGQPVIIADASQLRTDMAALYKAAGELLEAGGCEIRVKALDARTASQNARLWSILTEISRQVVWHGVKLTADEWKDVLSASLKRQKVVPGLDNGFVVVGGHTSKMSKRMHSDLMELATAFGAQHRVVFNDPKWREA